MRKKFVAIVTVALFLATAFVAFNGEASGSDVIYDVPDHIDVSTDPGYENVYPDTAEWIIVKESTGDYAELKLNGVNVKYAKITSELPLWITLEGDNEINTGSLTMEDGEGVVEIKSSKDVTITGSSLRVIITPSYTASGIKCTSENDESNENNLQFEDAEISIISKNPSAHTIFNKKARGISSDSHIVVQRSIISIKNLYMGVTSDKRIDINTDSFIRVDNPKILDYRQTDEYYLLFYTEDTVWFYAEPYSSQIVYIDKNWNPTQWGGNVIGALFWDKASIGEEPPAPEYKLEYNDIRAGNYFVLTIHTSDVIGEVYLNKFEDEEKLLTEEVDYVVVYYNDSHSKIEIIFNSDLTNEAGYYEFWVGVGAKSVSGIFSVEPKEKSLEQPLIVGIVLLLLVVAVFAMIAARTKD